MSQGDSQHTHKYKTITKANNNKTRLRQTKGRRTSKSKNSTQATDLQ